MNVIFRISCLVYLFIILWSCTAAPPQHRIFENPEKDLVRLTGDLEKARVHGVDDLAPQWFAEAESARDEAKKALLEGQSLDTIGAHLARFGQNLENAWATAQISGPILEQCKAARKQALTAGAEKLGSPFKSAEDQYDKLTRAVLNQNIVFVRKNGPKVNQAYLALELLAIQSRYLTPARGIMADAEKKGAPEKAPIMYAKSRAAMADVENFINRDPYNQKAIEMKTAETTFFVKRMAAISQSSELFSSMTPEETALYLEDVVGRFSRILGLSDLRDIPVDEQIDKATASAGKLHRTLEKLMSENNRALLRVAHLEKRLYALTSKQEEIVEKRLAARDNSRMMVKMKGVFDPDEAEVYRKGKQFVIRLRDIDFPKGEATLSPEHFSLLDKVQDVIKDFDDPRVTIEGYTDNGGTDQLDQLLSQMRAISIKAYLVGKKTLPPDKIETIGYNAALSDSKTGSGIQVWINPALPEFKNPD